MLHLAGQLAWYRFPISIVFLFPRYIPGGQPIKRYILHLLAPLRVNYKMLPEEVINATTLNSAYAMGVEEEVGSITVGKLANFYITKPIPGIEFLPYAYGSNLVDQVFLRGKQL